MTGEVRRPSSFAPVWKIVFSVSTSWGTLTNRFKSQPKTHDAGVGDEHLLINFVDTLVLPVENMKGMLLDLVIIAVLLNRLGLHRTAWC